MARITSIGSLVSKRNGIMPVYKRQNGTIFMKIDGGRHVRVEQRDNSRAWTAIEDVVRFDPVEMIEVIDE